jgi:DNA-binding LacI/PurR family transcriptional regulator
MHRVTHHQFHGMWLILRKLEEKGYRRIGLVMDELVDNKVDRTFTSCIAGYHLRIPPRNRVPILFQKVVPKFDPKILGTWIEKHKPDVIIGHDAALHHLRQLGLSVPGDIAVAHLGVPSVLNPLTSGLNQNWRLVGAAAVDTVVAQIYRNERGIPDSPQTIMLEGFWEEGNSTPDRHS